MGIRIILFKKKSAKSSVKRFTLLKRQNNGEIVRMCASCTPRPVALLMIFYGVNFPADAVGLSNGIGLISGLIGLVMSKAFVFYLKGKIMEKSCACVRPVHHAPLLY